MAGYSDIARAVLGMLDSGMSLSRVAGSLAGYLVGERQTRELDKITREVERLRLERDGIVEVVASSARPLSDSVRQEIGRLYSGKTIKIITEDDKSLVGGVRLRTLDSLADLTVRGRLHGLKNNNF